jgi:hypothetical protein
MSEGQPESGSRFYDAWDPRIGREAAGILKRRAWIVPVMLLGLAAIIVLAITAHGVAYGISAGLVAAAVIAPYLLFMRRVNRRLAAAMTGYLGMEVLPRHLPQFRSTDRFDAWLEAKKAGTRSGSGRFSAASSGSACHPSRGRGRPPGLRNRQGSSRVIAVVAASRIRTVSQASLV